MKTGEIILICGPICSGKSTLAAEIAREENALILSHDRLMLSLFPTQLGDRHDAVAAKVNDYLQNLACETAEKGLSVILDWGFWTRARRGEIDGYFRQRGYPVRWICLRLSKEEHLARVAKRNREAPQGSYPVDEALLEKCLSRYEEPDPALEHYLLESDETL